MSLTNSARSQAGQTCGLLCERLKGIRNDLFGAHGGPELARRVGVSAWQWAAYEGGEPTPAEVTLAFLNVTGCSPSWLLTGKDARFLQEPVLRDGALRTAGRRGQPSPAPVSEGSAKPENTDRASHRRQLKEEIARLRAQVEEIKKQGEGGGKPASQGFDADYRRFFRPKDEPPRLVAARAS